MKEEKYENKFSEIDTKLTILQDCKTRQEETISHAFNEILKLDK
jgi:hypothetical protein